MLKPGTIIGGTYRLRHLIAEGGMSEVYLADRCYEPEHSVQVFAVKRLLPKLSENALLAHLFEQEAALASVLHHPHIVACHDFIKEHGNLYMVMEYVCGKEVGVISQAISHHDISTRIQVATAIGLGALSSLIYVHEKTDSGGSPLNLVHGDISPQNIMITEHGIVKLYDFGAFNNELVDQEMVRGNIRYMSPEQAMGKRLDRRSDLFSLALVMLEIIVTAPFLGEKKEQSHLEAVIDEQLSSQRNLVAFLKGGLTFNVQERFSCARKMLDALREIALEYSIAPQILLEKSLKSIPSATVKMIRTRKQSREDRKSIIYLFFLVIGIFIAVGSGISVLSKVFEPKYQHNIPFWSEPTPSFVKNIEDNVKPEKQIIKQEGSLAFMVEPWAEVFVDGRLVGKTPMQALSLPAGQYVIQLKNPHVSEVALKVVTIYANKRTKIYHSFQKKDE